MQPLDPFADDLDDAGMQSFFGFTSLDFWNVGLKVQGFWGIISVLWFFLRQIQDRFWIFGTPNSPACGICGLSYTLLNGLISPPQPIENIRNLLQNTKGKALRSCAAKVLKPVSCKESDEEEDEDDDSEEEMMPVRATGKSFVAQLLEDLQKNPYDQEAWL